MKRWAALLKGVNVGGNRKLPMAELRALVAGLGHGDVETLLASGNVVFSAAGSAGSLIADLEKALADHGCTTRVLLRDREAMDAAIAANPFADAARDRPNHLLLLFHADPVPADALARLAEQYDGPERWQAVGRDLFVDFPDGIGRSKLVPAMARAKLPALATGRNWNTVVRLAEMLAA
jgi:uncharacterized protein (DUF1697 family)